MIKTLLGKTPVVGKDCFVAENSVLIGDVIIGDQCSIWYHTIIRGDVNSIRIGDRVNIQDHSMIHCTFEKANTKIGNDVSIGHRAIIHGCELQDNCLVGMGAIVMDNVVVESNALVAAGAVILEKTIVESGWIYAGVPAKKVKKLNPEEVERLISDTAKRYVKYMDWYRN